MIRAPYQVLIIPYKIMSNNEVLYAVFKRELSTGGYWQGIAGGGEKDETILESAKREASEEAGIEQESEYIKLDTITMIPVTNFPPEFQWGEDVLVIPEHCFGVRVNDTELKLSDEHTEFKWLPYNLAAEILYWDSNKTALWELDYRLKKSKRC